MWFLEFDPTGAWAGRVVVLASLLALAGYAFRTVAVSSKFFAMLVRSKDRWEALTSRDREGHLPEVRQFGRGGESSNRAGQRRSEEVWPQDNATSAPADDAERRQARLGNATDLYRSHRAAAENSHVNGELFLMPWLRSTRPSPIFVFWRVDQSPTGAIERDLSSEELDSPNHDPEFQEDQTPNDRPM